LKSRISRSWSPPRSAPLDRVDQNRPRRRWTPLRSRPSRNKTPPPRSVATRLEIATAGPGVALPICQTERPHRPWRPRCALLHIGVHGDFPNRSCGFVLGDRRAGVMARPGWEIGRVRVCAKQVYAGLAPISEAGVVLPLRPPQQPTTLRRQSSKVNDTQTPPGEYRLPLPTMPVRCRPGCRGGTTPPDRRRPAGAGSRAESLPADPVTMYGLAATGGRRMLAAPQRWLRIPIRRSMSPAGP